MTIEAYDNRKTHSELVVKIVCFGKYQNGELDHMADRRASPRPAQTTATIAKVSDVGPRCNNLAGDRDGCLRGGDKQVVTT